MFSRLSQTLGKSQSVFYSTASPQKNGTGVLMLNLGGPATQEEVQPFLTRLFSDREIIKIPFQKFSGPLLAKRRTPKVKKQYAMIGGGSPLRYWTEQQGKLMCAKLDVLRPETAPHKYYVGFRYADPMTPDTLEQIRKDNVKRVIAFSQYPQYSCSTTGSSLNELYRQLKKHDWLQEFEWSVIDRWPTHKGLIKAFAVQIQKALAQWDEADRNKVILLFSAHSLPMSVVNRGDSYPHEVAASVKQVMEELNHSNVYKIVWQSKVGPAKWLQPAADGAIEGLAAKGWTNQLLIPIAFTSDHIETLYEYDILYAELAKKLNIKLKRVNAFNDDPLFIEALADIVHTHLTKKEKSSTQLKLRCAYCVNDDCGPMKQFFTTQ